MSTDILVHAEAGITTLTFNRPDKKNSITSAMYASLADALEAAQADDTVRCVVFQGHEAVFSAGNDIGDFLNQPPATDESPVYRFMRALAGFSKPVLAAVCGPAVGIGTTLLLHCDLVYAGDNAAFSMPFVNLGLCPEFSSSLLVPQMMGYHRAAEALLLGEPFMAEAALEVGLVNRVLAADRGGGLCPDRGAPPGRQAAVIAGGNQAPDEAGPEPAGDGGDGRRRRRALAACCASRPRARPLARSWSAASPIFPKSDGAAGRARGWLSP